MEVWILATERSQPTQYTELVGGGSIKSTLCGGSEWISFNLTGFIWVLLAAIGSTGSDKALSLLYHMQFVLIIQGLTKIRSICNIPRLVQYVKCTFLLCTHVQWTQLFLWSMVRRDLAMLVSSSFTHFVSPLCSCIQIVSITAQCIGGWIRTERFV